MCWAGVARLAFLCQLSQIWHILKRLTVKKNHSLAFQPRVLTRDFLLPANSKYAKFEKVGIKMPTWQPWCRGVQVSS